MARLLPECRLLNARLEVSTRFSIRLPSAEPTGPRRRPCAEPPRRAVECVGGWGLIWFHARRLEPTLRPAAMGRRRLVESAAVH
jgi:hypothetical protein